MKGRRYSRLTEPHVRDARGALVPTSWNEAIGRAASGLRPYQGSQATLGFGLFSCSKATNEVNFLAQKFARQVMGCNNVDSCNRT